MPADLLDAIGHGRMILGWHEHLQEEDIPPRWMWALDEELERHFDRVKARREAGHRWGDDDDEEHGLVIRNEYAKGRGRG